MTFESKNSAESWRQSKSGVTLEELRDILEVARKERNKETKVRRAYAAPPDFTATSQHSTTFTQTAPKLQSAAPTSHTQEWNSTGWNMESQWSNWSLHELTGADAKGEAPPQLPSPVPTSHTQEWISAGWGSDNQWNDWLLHGSTITDIKGKARATQKLRETKRIRYSRNELLLLDPHNYSRIGEEAAALINKSKTSNYHQHRTPHVRVVRPVRQPPKDAFGFAPGVAAPEQIGALPIYDGL